MYINVCVFKREIESVECVAMSVSKDTLPSPLYFLIFLVLPNDVSVKCTKNSRSNGHTGATSGSEDAWTVLRVNRCECAGPAAALLCASSHPVCTESS